VDAPNFSQAIAGAYERKGELIEKGDLDAEG